MTNVTAKPDGTAGTAVTSSAGGLSGGSGVGGSNAAGGTPTSTGGTPGATAGSSTAMGGASLAGANAGGVATGGLHSATGGVDNGGASATGGVNNGGASATGGVNNGGASATGGVNSGGASATGGVNNGGASATGGVNNGGANAAGGLNSATGGVNSGGAGNATSALLKSCTLLYRMDEPSWNGTAGEVFDSSGSGNSGTAVSGATTGTPAKFGRAALFDGTNYITVNSSTTLHALSAFTLSTWIMPTGLDGSNSPGIFDKRWAYGDSAELNVFIWSDNRLFVDIDGDNDRFSSNVQFVDNLWYHVAVVFDGSLPTDQRVSVYINGQLDSTHAESTATATVYDSPIEIGRLREGGGSFKGSIDEVAFWQRALSSSEVASIFASAVPLH